VQKLRNHASIMSKHGKLAKCVSGVRGCRCVTCYNYTGIVSAVCGPYETSDF
jgi:hypothetical protein